MTEQIDSNNILVPPFIDNPDQVKYPETNGRVRCHKDLETGRILPVRRGHMRNGEVAGWIDKNDPLYGFHVTSKAKDISSNHSKKITQKPHQSAQVVSKTPGIIVGTYDIIARINPEKSMVPGYFISFDVIKSQ